MSGFSVALIGSLMARRAAANLAQTRRSRQPRRTAVVGGNATLPIRPALRCPCFKTDRHTSAARIARARSGPPSPPRVRSSAITAAGQPGSPPISRMAGRSRRPRRWRTVPRRAQRGSTILDEIELSQPEPDHAFGALALIAVIDCRRASDCSRPKPDMTGSAYSITSSARARINGGIVRPSALAVLRLMMSLNVVGCSIGRSAG
jgi:hypothetical protein